MPSGALAPVRVPLTAAPEAAARRRPAGHADQLDSVRASSKLAAYRPGALPRVPAETYTGLHHEDCRLALACPTRCVLRAHGIH